MNGFNKIFIDASGFEFLSQASDVDFHGMLLWRRFRCPEVFKNEAATQNSAIIAEKQF